MRRASVVIALLGTCWSISGVVSGCGSDEKPPSKAKILEGGVGEGGTRFNNDSGGGGAYTQSPFGGKCLEDADCPKDGVVCLKESGTELYGGGPTNGICSLPCTTPDDCAAIDPNSYCVFTNDNGTPRDNTDDSGFCMEACTIGIPPIDEIKCHDRIDMACFPDSSGFGGYCFPTCVGDEQCGDRVCSLNDGVCEDASTRTGTLPIGAECDPTATDDPCALGFCYKFTDTYAVCSGGCSWYNVGCGADLSSADPLDAYCLLTSADSYIGDLGLCSQLCDCDDDCLASGSVCLELISDLATFTGRAGYCYPREFSDLGTDGGFDVELPCAGGTRDAGTDSGTPTTMPDSGTPTTTPDAGAPDGG